MTTKLEKLSYEQEALIKTVRDEWLNRFFSCKTELDEPKAKEAIDWLYSFSKLKKPLIIKLHSPIACQYAVPILREMLKNGKFNQVWGQVWGQVGDQVGDQVGGQKMTFESFASYGSVSDYGWVAFYDFFLRIGVLKKEELAAKNLIQFADLLKTGIYDMIQLDGACIYCPLPSYVERDANNRLHSETGKAIAWRGDGWGLHYLSGIPFEEKLWKKVVGKKMKFKDLMAMENMDQRMAALKIYGADYVLKESKAKLIKTSERGNALYKVSNVFPQDEFFLRYECPSTGHVYVKCVDPEVGKKGDPDACQAWSFSVEPIEYQSLKLEA